MERNIIQTQITTIIDIGFIYLLFIYLLISLTFYFMYLEFLACMYVCAPTNRLPNQPWYLQTMKSENL